jgi:S1-C subfamily serine protease
MDENDEIPASPSPQAAAPVGSGAPAWWSTPGPYWAASTPPPNTRRFRTITAAALLVVVAMAAGFGVGRVTWQPRSAAALQQPSASSPSAGSGGSPFVPNSPFDSPPSGLGGSPSGSGSSGQSITNAAGGPSNASAIATGVDPGLVDVNTTLGLEGAAAAGTGIVLTSTGEVLTNNHVIDGATSVSVTDIGNGRTYSARVVGYDRSNDIAVLQLKGASGLTVASIDGSSKVVVGEAVVAIGNVGGTGGKPSVAGGSVTGVGKSITASEQDGANPEQLTGLIEVNADIQAGDSGGPLVNRSGKVLGIDTAASVGFSFSTSSADGYAIPISTASALARQIESATASATVHIGPTAFLGVSLTDGAQGANGLGGSSETGAALAGVVAGSPADSAGLAAGDVITSLGGDAVTSPTELTSLLERYHPGDQVQLGWTDASGKQHRASLQLATGPAS